jgi:hypothetical protein
MNTQKLLSLTCLAAFAVICLPMEKLSAQGGGPPRAWETVTFANGNSIAVRGNRQEKFRPVAILSGETLNIQLQLAPRSVNTVAAVQAVDGGIVTQRVVIAPDGTTALEFHAGVQPGLYRILLTARGRPVLMQFRVPNSGNS